MRVQWRYGSAATLDRCGGGGVWVSRRARPMAYCQGLADCQSANGEPVGCLRANGRSLPKVRTTGSVDCARPLRALPRQSPISPPAENLAEHFMHHCDVVRNANSCQLLGQHESNADYADSRRIQRPRLRDNLRNLRFEQ